MARRTHAESPSLTQERLKTVFDYSPETGRFFRYIAVGRATVGEPTDRCRGYVVISIDGVRYFGHRLAWLYVHGTWPTNQLDHINGIRDDNRIANLREATNTENCRNGGKPISNKSGFKGVFWDRYRWVAQIKFNGKIIRLGRFLTAEEAYDAYCEGAKKLHGLFWNPGTKGSFRRGAK